MRRWVRVAGAPHTRVGKFEDQRHQLGTEELRLVDADHVHPLGRGAEQFALTGQLRADGLRVGHRHRFERAPGMAGDFAGVVAVVDGRLEHGDPLPGDQGASQAANEFFALAAEHGTDDHFEVAAGVGRT